MPCTLEYHLSPHNVRCERLKTSTYAAVEAAIGGHYQGHYPSVTVYGGLVERCMLEAHIRATKGGYYLMKAHAATQPSPVAGGGTADERRTIGLMAAIFGVLLLLGIFVDEPIEHALYVPHNVIATLITTVGIYPFAASVVLFMGVACERTVHSDKSMILKIVFGIITITLALLVGYAGASFLTDEDCLGGIMPAIGESGTAKLVLSLIVEWPLFLVGWQLANRNDDKTLAKKAVCFTVVVLAAFAVMQMTKGIFNRPRYRVVAEGFEGVGFVPWYKISPDPADLIAAYGLKANDFRSFPSGHAVLSISVISILLSLSWLIPSLRGKEVKLCWMGFAFAVVIMFTRMLLGAHYLSDVCAGALIGLVFVFIYDVLQRRIGTSVG